MYKILITLWLCMVHITIGNMTVPKLNMHLLP